MFTYVGSFTQVDRLTGRVCVLWGFVSFPYGSSRDGYLWVGSDPGGWTEQNRNRAKRVCLCFVPDPNPNQEPFGR